MFKGYTFLEKVRQNRKGGLVVTGVCPILTTVLFRIYLQVKIVFFSHLVYSITFKALRMRHVVLVGNRESVNLDFPKSSTVLVYAACA